MKLTKNQLKEIEKRRVEFHFFFNGRHSKDKTLRRTRRVRALLTLQELRRLLKKPSKRKPPCSLKSQHSSGSLDLPEDPT